MGVPRVSLIIPGDLPRPRLRERFFADTVFTLEVGLFERRLDSLLRWLDPRLVELLGLPELLALTLAASRARLAARPRATSSAPESIVSGDTPVRSIGHSHIYKTMQMHKGNSTELIDQLNSLALSWALTPHGRGHITGYVEHFCSFYVDITGWPIAQKQNKTDANAQKIQKYVEKLRPRRRTAVDRATC